jgi:hypothetical protein
MSVQNMFIMDATERTAAEAFDTDDVALGARAVDNASPGVGLNLNPDAANYAPGASVALTDKYVAPKRIVDDPDYQTYAPGLITYLLGLPWAALETETIFAPASGPG